MITKEQKEQIIDSMVEGLLELQEIYKEEVEQTKSYLHRMSIPKLKKECNEYFPDEWKRIVG
jgi:hypothetical protein